MFIICWLLHPNPRWRATMSDLEENDWINQYVDIKKYSFEAVLGKLKSLQSIPPVYYIALVVTFSAKLDTLFKG